MNAWPSVRHTMTAVEWWERQHYGTGRTTLGIGTSLTPDEWIVRVNGWTPPSDFITVYGTLEAAQRAADSTLLHDVPHDCLRCGCSEWKMLADEPPRGPQQRTLELQTNSCAVVDAAAYSLNSSARRPTRLAVHLRPRVFALHGPQWLFRTWRHSMKRTGLMAAMVFALGCGVAAAQSAGSPPQGGSPARPGTDSQQGGGSQSDGARGGGTTAPDSGRGNRAASQSQTVTVIGCVQAGDQARSGTGSGRSGTGQAGAQSSAAYILTNARMGAGGGAAGAGNDNTATSTRSGAGTSGATGTSAGGGVGTTGSGAGANAGSVSGTTFMLEGNDLAQHVGHQVEVTGRMTAPAAGSGSGNAAATSGTSRSDAETRPPTGGDRSANAGASAGGDRSTAGASQGTDTRLQVTAVRMLSSTCNRQ